jgi:opacity protein-like surface antigen
LPIATSTMLGVIQNGASFALRFGYLGANVPNGSSGSNFAATAILPAGLGASLALTAGMTSQYGAEGGSKVMLGAGGDARIMSFALASTANAPSVTLTVNGELGYSQRAVGRHVSGYVGLPITLIPAARPSEGLHFIPFITPGFGFGDLKGAGIIDGSGSRWLVGGGVALFNPASNVMVDFGFQYVGIRSGSTMFGLGVVLGGK